MPNSGLIDRALIAVLSADSTLQGLLPDGVFVDVAKPGATKFVLVSLAESHDEPEFQGRAWEEGLYLIKAVMLDTSPTAAMTAAARIDAILEDQALTVSGYNWMTTYREFRVDTTETDDLDMSIRWQHRGGYYRVMMSGN